ncbi:MAG: DUF1861 family protein [Clostridia bacterium]|nr:DUF1861 family protein [Clostridia bacterium]
MTKDLQQIRIEFEKNKKIYDSALLTFRDVKKNVYSSSDDGFDAYNCSVPFIIGGKKYCYGRIEKHNVWADSTVHLFEETSKDVFDEVAGAMIYQNEDPYVQFIDGELVMGGTRVTKSAGEINYFDASFYRGKDVDGMVYYTQGPMNMKDIRLVQMPDGIGVFTRPDGKIGFTKIKSMEELTPEVIKNAELIDAVDKNGYGGCNQCYYLSSGKIGVIAHMVYTKIRDDKRPERVYVNTAFVFDPESRKTLENKIIGTRLCYPASDHVRIKPDGIPLDDTVFTSGFLLRDDGKVDLYSGVSDALQGRITIDYPFEGYGEVVYGDLRKGV